MKFKGTLFLLLVVIVAGLYIYLYEIRGEAGRMLKKEREERLFMRDTSDVAELSLKNYYGRLTFKKDQNGKWKIISPVTYSGNQQTISDLVKFAVEARYEGKVAEPGSDLTQFGLDNPECVIDLKFTDGTKGSIVIGKKTPIGTQVYSFHQKDSSVVVLLNSIWEKSNKEHIYYRNRDIIPIEPEQVKKLTYTGSGSAFELEKNHINEWVLKKPIVTRADQNAIEQLLKDLKTSRVRKFFDNENKSNRHFGLQKPQYTIDLFFGKGNWKYSLQVGTADDDTVFVYCPQKDLVFGIDLVDRKKFDPDLYKFRDKSVVWMNNDAVNSIELHYPGRMIECKKDINNVWRVEKPRKSNGKSYIIAAILSDLSLLRAKEIIEKPRFNESLYGTDKPVVEVALKINEKEIQRVKLGKTKNELIYLYNITYKKMFLVDKNILEKLTFKVEDLAEKI